MPKTRRSYDVHFLSVDDEPFAHLRNMQAINQVRRSSELNEMYKVSSTAVHQCNAGTEAEGLIRRVLNISGDRLDEEKAINTLFIGLLDQRMPEMNGTELAYALNRKFPDAAIVWVLRTAFATDQEVQEAQKHGVHMALSKGRTDGLPQIIASIYDALHHIAIREPSEKKDITEPLVFKPITSIDEMVQVFKLRYDVYSADRRLNEKNTTGFDVTPHDALANHYGGFRINAAGNMELVATVRMITHQQIPLYAGMVHQVIANEPALAKYLRETQLLTGDEFIKPENHPTVLDVQKERGLDAGLVQDFVALASDPAMMELSRNIVREDFRGQDIKLMVDGFAAEHSLRQGYRGAILSCAPRLFPMYAILGTKRAPLGMVYMESVRYYSTIGSIMFENVSDRCRKIMEAMGRVLQAQDHVIVTPKNQSEYK